jgi:hypothetical protein
MNKVTYYIDTIDNILYRVTDVGNNSSKVEPVINKDAFIACYNEWIKQENKEDEFKKTSDYTNINSTITIPQSVIIDMIQEIENTEPVAQIVGKTHMNVVDKNTVISIINKYLRL